MKFRRFDTLDSEAYGGAKDFADGTLPFTSVSTLKLASDFGEVQGTYNVIIDSKGIEITGLIYNPKTQQDEDNSFAIYTDNPKFVSAQMFLANLEMNEQEIYKTTYSTLKGLGFIKILG